MRDASFSIVKILSAAETMRFEKLMREGVVVEVPHRGECQEGHYKLDVRRRGSSGGRWLYQTTGHVTVLSAMRMPVYRLRDPETFNRLIGASP